MNKFELIRNNGLGRLGKLKTKHGNVLTPELMPVYNPNIPLISTKELIEEFDIKILITNAYIINRTERLRKNAEEGVHKLIDFPRIIMLDSGAYQAWVYHEELTITNREIIEFQCTLRPDIGTILDIFTDTNDYETAKQGVIETINRAKECLEIVERLGVSDILWAAPIQGGKFTDLVKYSAIELSKLDFDYHPIGTLAPELMRYNYRPVLEGIATAKINMDVSRPLHAFSIGHPMFFALSVLFGADLFDSSSYALYAKDGRYITPTGTLHIKSIVEFPCSCKICTDFTPDEIRKMDQNMQIKLLAKHNLYVCLSEMRNIREAIRQDKLWELVQTRVRAHPNLLDAYLYCLKKFSENLEMNDPITKRSAFFYVGLDSLLRPEINRHIKCILERYTPPENSKILIILPDLYTRPIESRIFKNWMKKIIRYAEKNDNIKYNDIHFCILSPIFGIIPYEISDFYPLTQYMYPNIFLEDLSEYYNNQLITYLSKFSKYYKKVIIFYPDELINLLNIQNYPKLKEKLIFNTLKNKLDILITRKIDDLKNLIQNLFIKK